MESLAARFLTMVFLATPHRGSDSAATLDLILRYTISLSTREYVRDLGRNTGAVQTINEDFRHVAGDIQLFSFYETVKTSTSFGLGNVMIVEKDSAVLGYPNEKSQPVDANHREICKFDRRTDSSYLSIRNVLASITSDIVKEGMFSLSLRGLGVLTTALAESSISDQQHTQLQSIKVYLGIIGDQEQDLTSLQEAHMEGSCQWLLSREYFRTWRDDPSTQMRCLWLSGKPGLGKSVLSSNVIKGLQESNVNPCYYFFKHGDKIKSTVSGLLRSIAFQMAIIHPAMREKLVGMQKQEANIDVDDERGIWRKVFLGGIFQSNLTKPHYWVIDALDECDNSSMLFSLISRKESNLPIRILVTSRISPSLKTKFIQLGDSINVVGEEISTDDTLEDIQKYVMRKSGELSLGDEATRKAVEQEILSQPEGSFLWVKLVMNQLCDAHTIDVL